MHLRLHRLAGLLVVVLATGTAASAASIAISNPGFETNPAADPDGINGAPNSAGNVSDWITGGAGAFLAVTFDPGPDAGDVFFGENNYLALQANGAAFSSAIQIVDTTILPATRYTLTVDVASDARFEFSSFVPSDDNYEGFPGQTVLARLVNSATNLGFGETAGVTLVTDAAVVPGGTATTWTFVYETDDSPANLDAGLYIQLFIQSDETGGRRTALFDNAALDVVSIPEPGTAWLFGAGILAVARRKRG
jgi:hypothetical protein